ncbi:MAG: hypothetical protein IJZ33_03485 [Clostridia bacterium]|nr:hypothetical protein [Clostridia bacterium]
MRYLIIDIGSNTVKYDVFDSCGGKKPVSISHRSRALGIINYIEKGALTPEGMEVLCSTLEDYKRDGEQAGAAILPFATASLRRLDDPLPVLTAIKERTGLSVRLLSGSEEASCSFFGMLSTMNHLPAGGFMADMGGGSTELNRFEKGRSLYLHSCPFGALSVKNAVGAGDAITAREAALAREHVLSLLPRELSSFGRCGKRAVLVGGTAKACRSLAREFLKKKGGNRLSRDDFSALLSRITDPDEQTLERMKELIPQRYHLMGAGMTAFDTIFEVAGTKEILICRGGIREGFLEKTVKGLPFDAIMP